jgi:hypothetical protein
VRSFQIAAASTAAAIAGTAMHAPMRKWLRTIGSLPVKVTAPPPAFALLPRSLMNLANTASMLNSAA